MSRHLSPATAKVYLASIAAAHRRHGFSNPLRHNPTLTLALRGLKRSKATLCARHQRAALTPPVLRSLLLQLSHTREYCHHDRRMLRAAFLLAFFGFLRVSEFAVTHGSSFDPRMHATMADITWHKEHHLTFHLRRSKTDQLARGHDIVIGPAHNGLCPIQAMRWYFKSCPHSPVRSPLFHLSSGRPLTRRFFLRCMRDLLRAAGFDALAFNTHSLRIGAATTAAQAGIPTHLIQRLGRWRSKAYRSYVRGHPTQLRRLTMTLAHTT